MALGNASSYDPADPYSQWNIGRVIVGPSTEAAGIQGSILAEYGKIGSIYSMGPIGGPSVAATIHAGNGIVEIRAMSDSNTSTRYTNVDFNLDVVSNMHPLLPDTYPQPKDEGVCGLIETGGNISGTIRAQNIVAAGNGGGGASRHLPAQWSHRLLRARLLDGLQRRWLVGQQRRGRLRERHGR